MNTPALRGVAALSEMLDCIGGTDASGAEVTDHDVAKMLSGHELPLRALLRYALDQLASEP